MPRTCCSHIVSPLTCTDQQSTSKLLSRVLRPVKCRYQLKSKHGGGLCGLDCYARLPAHARASSLAVRVRAVHGQSNL